MLVWGGSSQAACLPTTVCGDGGSYDPSTDTWQALSRTGAPSPRSSHTATWTGTQMLVWGGQGPDRAVLGDGARYDPATDTWRPISGVAAPSARGGHLAVWTGAELLIWGGGTGTGPRGDGAAYNPTTDTWRRLPVAGAPPSRTEQTGVWTGGALLVWGRALDGGELVSDGDQYDPLTDQWTPLADDGAPSPRIGHTAVSTGTEMLVWGGYGEYVPRPTGLHDGARFLTWLSDGATYQPATDTWTPLPRLGAPYPRAHHTAVWTGSEMLIWGGAVETGELRAGAVYAPDQLSSPDEDNGSTGK